MDNEVFARVHSFDTFGAVDGPGIRFIIFMQGCALRCKYCQNRDTWNCNAGTMYSVSELVEKVLRYKNYFLSSGGGVTVSGGEPLLQQDFLIEFFKELKKYGISTAIDTSGMFQITPKLEELIKYTDLFLLDIKSINDEMCQNITGFSNKLELNFANYLSQNGKKIWIRHVLVPGYTDSEKDLLKLKSFLASLNTVEKIDILPYHDLGKFKWENLNQIYPLENIRTANEDDVKKAKLILGL
ncbi:MAG: pyruvate formate lyase-activating protein [Clostridia bacterium]|nr:pyruvate formate lyase-activating protein [Clostridia bacterium]